MPELLLEILSEEIPARMQQRAAADLERLMNEKLLGAGFMPEGVKAFATPRRLALVATGLPRRQPDRKEEKKGPRVGAPEKAIEGFLKSAGVASLDKCEMREDKKGQFYVAIVDERGRETADVVRDVAPEIVRTFPWPKSMRWGDGDLRWVRPIHSILCAFDGEIVPISIDGVVAGDETHGHRFMSKGAIRARSFESYAAQLKSAKVLLDREERITLIAAEARTLCEAQGLTLVEDDGLLAEVAGLAEWPVVMIGAFDKKFLALPDEVLTATMRGHQKYFSVKDPKIGRLANRFVFVANIEAPDGGAAMRPGYERVLTARLSDAWYLYNKDLKRPLADRVADLDRVTFFEGLGSIGDKARRVAALAKEIAPKVGADAQLAEQAALLAKADLTTGMVYEFPELQGIMGRYYARAQGVNESVADAIRDHYKPKGADDDAPTAPVTVAVALADKIDTLTAFWAIDKTPTGSSDPFALRRAALGVISLVSSLDHFALRLIIDCAIEELIVGLAFARIIGEDVSAEGEVGPPEVIQFWRREENDASTFPKPTFVGRDYVLETWRRGRVWDFDDRRDWRIIAPVIENTRPQGLDALSGSIVAFFHDRLKVYLRDKGHRHDHIDAVLTEADGSLEDDLVLIVMKLEALEAFLKTDDGANLAAAYKRAANILKAEEKKDAGRMKSAGDPSASGGDHGDSMADFIRPTEESLLRLPEEKALYAALKAADEKAKAAVAAEKFADAMAALASLRRPVDSFFEKVTVNDPDPALRANRLGLLANLRAATARVADLSKLEG